MWVFDKLFCRQKKTTTPSSSREVAKQEKKEEPKAITSSDFTYKEAISKIDKLKTTGDVNSFTKGDDRKTIKTAVNKKLKDLSLPSKPKKVKKSTPGR